MEYVCASAKAAHESLFILTASPRGPISDPRDRTGNQLRQTRGRTVHETVLYMGLPQPKPFCIDLSESEAICWHQVLEDGGVAPVSRTQCDYYT